MSSAFDALVPLRDGPVGGLTVPVAAIQLLWGLQGRGFVLEACGDDLEVWPAHELTDADRALLRRWKPHVRALLAYEPPA